MDYPLILFFALLNVAVVATHAALPPEVYWKSVLPTTPMPKAITDILHPDLGEEKSTYVGVGKGGVNVKAGKGKPGSGGTSVNVGRGGVSVHAPKGKGKPGGTTVNVGKGIFVYNWEEEKGTYVGVGKGSGVNVDAGKGKPGGTSVNVGKGGVNVNTGKGGGTHVNVGGKGGGVNVHAGKGRGTNVNVGGGKGGGVSVNTGHKGKPVHVAVGAGNPFQYNYAVTETQLHDDPNAALFFLEQDLNQGTKLNNIHFTKTSTNAPFLPRHVSNSIPFSSNKLPQILNEFSIQPGSQESLIIQNTIKECEQPGIKGEEKYCATSLESMVDFSTSKLGKNVVVLSTELDKETKVQDYTVAPGVKRVAGDKAVVCHKQDYPYAVFYCHKTETTRAFNVPLVGDDDGTRVKAVAVCHTDTSQWNPKHLAFQVLKVKPGTPVCHFLPEDHLVWVPK